MKKFLIPLVMVTVVAIVFAGCMAGAPEVAPPVEPVAPPVEPVTPPVEEEKLQIVCVLQLATIDFFAPSSIGAKDAGEEYGADVIWTGPPTFDVLEMIGMLETFLAKGEVDGFVIEAVDPDQLLPIVKQITEAGIPVVLTNELFEHDYYDGFCGSDAAIVGMSLAEQMEEILLGKGVWAEAVGYEGTGEVEGKIAFLNDTPGALNSGMRAYAARAYLAQFPGIVDLGIFATTMELSEATEVCINLLVAHPDLAGFIPVGVGPTTAAGLAVEKMGLAGEVIIIGMDPMPESTQLVKSKVIASQIGQNTYDQGYLPVKAICEYLVNDVPIPKWMPSGLYLVTLENADYVLERLLEQGWYSGE